MLGGLPIYLIRMGKGKSRQLGGIWVGGRWVWPYVALMTIPSI
jgi:hypothetical protein